MTMMPDQNAPSDDARPRMKRGLGRGLNSLLGGGSAAAAGEQNENAGGMSEIPVGVISANPYQPRKDFDAESLGELIASIQKRGVLQPLLVRKHEGAYQLIAGERRLRAAREAGLPTVPCRVLELDERQVCEAAIEENLKRKDLNVLEKAEAFKSYLERFESTIEDLARQLGLNRSTVSNMLRLLELCDEVKAALTAEKITQGHARALLPLCTEQQIALCEQIQKESLSVRQTEKCVRDLQSSESPTLPFEAAGESHGEGESAEAPAEEATAAANNHLLSLQDQLREVIGAKVEIKLTGKESGRIVIEFHSNSDFAHIIRQLRRAA